MNNKMNEQNRSYFRRTRKDYRPVIDELPLNPHPIPVEHRDPTLQLGVGCRWKSRESGAE